MNVLPNISNPKRNLPRQGAQPVHFGAGLSQPLEVKGVTGAVDKAFRSLTADRTMQMLVEDLIGFGLMRTGMDLWRGKEYGGQMNGPAALERMGRETASIVTDNVLAGIVAAGIGKYIFDKTSSNKTAAFNNRFVDFATLEKFQEVAGKMKAGQESEHFLSELASSYFRLEHREDAAKALKDVWNQSVEGFDKASDEQKKTLVADATKKNTQNFLEKLKLSKLGPKVSGFTYVLSEEKGKPNKVVNVHALMEDVGNFSQHMQKLAAGKTTKPWATLAQESIARTIKAKNVTIPVGLTAAMLTTFAVPFAISGISRKFFGIDYYPGEIGLRKEDDNPQTANPLMPRKSFWEKHAPYLTQSIKDGNYWPLLVTLSPLPLAAGLLNTTKLNKYGMPVLVKSWKEWKHLLDYQKLKPFTAQQQMASLFALLITARLLNSRSDNEYRERVLDSFVGWGAWIMGTPLLNKVAANALDKVAKTKLVRETDGGLRTRAEIEALKDIEGVSIEGVSKDILQKTLKSHIWMNVGTTATTMIGLGLVIPWMGIKLTQNNEAKKQRLREAQTTKTNVPVFSKPGFTPLSQSTPFNNPYTAASQPGLSVSPSPWTPAVSPFGQAPQSLPQYRFQ